AIGDCQRVRGGDQLDAHRCPRGAGPDSVWRHPVAQLDCPAPGARRRSQPCGELTVRRYLLRRVTNTVVMGLCILSLVLALIPLVWGLWLVTSHGIAGLSWSFFTALPSPVGEAGGGVGNAIVGTFYIVGLACLIGLPFGIGAGVFLAERGDGPFGQAVRFIAEVLSGVPSIVIGVVAYGLVVVPMKRFSALAGAVALAILMMPTL